MTAGENRAFRRPCSVKDGLIQSFPNILCSIEPIVPGQIVAVFCYPGDTAARLLAARIEALSPGSCRLFDLSLGMTAGLTVTTQSVLWDGLDLGAFEQAWLSDLSYMDPVVPAAASHVDWSLWRYEHLVDQQKFSALESVFMEIERRGVRLINSRGGALAHFMKPQQLRALVRQGIEVPDMLVSNEMERVTDFCQRHVLVLWRPCTGRAAWQRFTDRQRLHLVALDKPPVLLCAGEQSSVMRAWLLDGELLGCTQVSAPEQHPVDILGAAADYGELARMETLELFTPVDMDDEIRTALGQVAQAARLRRVQITFTLRDRRPCIYDIDPDPRLGDLPVALRDVLIDGCAHVLLGENPDSSGFKALPAVMERPALFLRRMLQIQFDMERSKYAEDDS